MFEIVYTQVSGIFHPLLNFLNDDDQIKVMIFNKINMLKINAS